MEFEGRIQRVLPVRSGTSQRGEWKVLPFVFEYFETNDQRWSDKVLLETMEPGIMGKIGAYIERGADNKGIVENGCMKLKAEIKCRCGFSHNVRDWEGKLYNQIGLYKFELIDEPQAEQPQQPQTQQQPLPLQEHATEDDDLPF